MLTKRKTIALALALGTSAGASTSLMADPPAVSEAEMEANFERYRDEMGHRQKQTDARLRRERSNREREAAVRERVRRSDAHTPPQQAELDAFSLDPTAMLDGVSLGMFQEKPAADAKPAAPGAAAAGKPSLAEQATNPAAPLIQFQLQNTSNGRTVGADGYGNTFVVQPVIPFKIGDQQWISRTTMPLIATADLGDPIGRKYGVGDIVTINFATFHVDKGGPWEGMIGVGPALTFPTASSDFLGEGKYQAGPNFLYINTATPHWQWGILAYQQWSFASSGGDNGRPEVSKLFLQPILTYHLGKGWFIASGDFLWSIDWNDDAQWSIPLGVVLGRVTKIGKQPVKMFIEPFYNVMTPDSGGTEWGVKVGLTLLFPE